MRKILTSLCLCAASAVLYAFSFPSVISTTGLFPLAFVFLVPAAIAIRSLDNLPWIACGGALFGLAGYGIFNYWLFNFDPLAPFFVLPVCAIEYSLIFLGFGMLRRAMPDWGWLPAIAFWVGSEYLKTRGFLGYPFGIIGYSQSGFLALAQAASIGGVWLVSALVVAPQLAFAWRSPGAAKKRRLMPVLVPALLLVVVVAWGFFRLSGSREAPDSASVRISVVQPCRASDEKGSGYYLPQLRALIKLSQEALVESPDIIVWPETAVIPSMDWHRRYRPDAQVYSLVAECLDFIKASGVDFIIGNDHGEVDPRSPSRERMDFNAALAFRKGTDSPSIYEKQRLVPFNEYFPFEGIFSGLRNFLLKRVGPFFTPGVRTGPLQAGGVRVSTPICFEDGFGDVVREHALKGARILVPIIDDSWSHSVAAEYQHLSCSVFRSIETGLPTARCANSGISCFISGYGKITASLEPFKTGVLTRDVAVPADADTVYMAIGDAFPLLCIGILIIAVLVSVWILVRRATASAKAAETGKHGT